LMWTASPGASAYRFSGRSLGPDWQHDMLVGNVTEATLPTRSSTTCVWGGGGGRHRPRESRLAVLSLPATPTTSRSRKQARSAPGGRS
jgi:hypothetical protein